MTLQEKLKGRHLILGSGSPRRQQFLQDLGLDFEIRKKEIEEHFPSTLSHKAIPEYLAELKAQPHLSELAPEDILLTADTIVWSKGRVLHKPKTPKQNHLMLKELSGQKHEVISSVRITSSKKFKTVTGITTVFFHTLTNSEIQFYIDTFQPFDKAGGYGIQEWIGKIGIQKIEGSFYTVMGMPIDQVYRALLHF